MKRSILYEIDLTKIDRNGAFPCPKCGAVISPADECYFAYPIAECCFLLFDHPDIP